MPPALPQTPLSSASDGAAAGAARRAGEGDSSPRRPGRPTRRGPFLAPPGGSSAGAAGGGRRGAARSPHDGTGALRWRRKASGVPPQEPRLQGARLLPTDLRCQAVLSREWFVISKKTHKNNKTKILTLPPIPPAPRLFQR